MAETKLHDADNAADAVHQAAAAGRKALEEGYDNLREYGEKSVNYAGRLTGDLVEFVKREPLIAVGAAFLVGYVAAQVFRRVPS
jgi:ElaB/YqjD/DUF883 family membrane-anchored ribosome-binding protein